MMAPVKTPHPDTADAMARAYKRLPPRVRMALAAGAGGASLDTRHCTFDLWARSEAGPEGRFLSVSPTAAVAHVYDKISVLGAATYLESLGLLREIAGVGDHRIWQWLVSDVVSRLERTLPLPDAHGELPADERMRLQQLRG